MLTPNTQEAPAIKSRERRGEDRVDVQLNITIESESNFFMGFSQNISEGGLFIATHDHKDVGDKLTISFGLPDGQSVIEARCEVCWVREFNPTMPFMTPGMGVRFLDLSPWDHERVQDFCAELREAMFIDMDMD